MRLQTSHLVMVGLSALNHQPANPIRPDSLAGFLCGGSSSGRVDFLGLVFTCSAACTIEPISRGFVPSIGYLAKIAHTKRGTCSRSYLADDGLGHGQLGSMRRKYLQVQGRRVVVPERGDG
jgi:hypothetical protein